MAQQINIYIETSCRGPAPRRAAGAWFLEYTRSSGKLETRGGILYADRTTENELTLALVRSAFSRLTKPCECLVFTECSNVLNTMRNGWMWQWRENGWITAKGTMAKNAEAWRRCADVMEQHTARWIRGPHSYRILIQSRLIKELSASHDPPTEGIYSIVNVPEWNT